MRKLRKPYTGVRRRRSADRAGDGAARAGWRASRAGRLTLTRASQLEHLPWAVHGFSTRSGGLSLLGEERVLNLGWAEWDTREAVEANRAAFLRGLGGGRMWLVTLEQCHSDVMYLVDSPRAHELRGDALVTRTPGLLLAVQTADCVPILLADARHRAVAAVHAGWRGTLARIAEKTLGRMRMEFDTRAEDVVAALGPAIGGCCYEVGPEVAQAFAAQFPEAREWFEGPFDRLAGGDDPAPFPWLSMTPPGHEEPAPRVRLDLRAANRRQLESAGVPAAQIATNALCTACRRDLLFSHRGERGRTGRMMAVIGIRA